MIIIFIFLQYLFHFILCCLRRPVGHCQQCWDLLSCRFGDDIREVVS